MSADLHELIRRIPPAKAIAIAMYGESVASYRYRTLHERITQEPARSTFAEMAEEEHGHHELLRSIRDQHFPDADYVLAPEDKELVIVGPRLLEVGDSTSLAEAMRLIYESERKTGRFYAAWRDVVAVESLKPLFDEMARECMDHAERLRSITLA